MGYSFMGDKRNVQVDPANRVHGFVVRGHGCFLPVGLRVWRLCAPGDGAGAEGRGRACCAASFAKNGFTTRGLNLLSGTMPLGGRCCDTLVPVSWAMRLFADLIRRGFKGLAHRR